MISRPVEPPTDREINEICRIINSNLGFNYSSQKRYLIESRLAKRLTELNFNYRQYLEFLQREPAEQSILYDLLTTNVTSFFREPEQFEFLRKSLLPQIKATKKNRRLRCWSAGCSSGEEAYSLAITCLESLDTNWDIKILATDISFDKLQKASSGLYSKEQVAVIPAVWRSKYFQADDEEKALRVVPELREKVFFRRANLLANQDLPASIRLDIIFCRNVFIYLSKESRQKILTNFFRRLTDNGYLFLGHSESINLSADLRWDTYGNSIYLKRTRSK